MTNAQKEAVKAIKLAQRALATIEDSALTSKQSRQLMTVLDSFAAFIESLAYDGDN